MSTQDRRIGFYSLEFRKYRAKQGENIFFDMEIFKNLLEYVGSLPEDEKIIRLDQYKKAVTIGEIAITSINNNYSVQIVFKSCKYEHNPRYMSSIDGSERDSDKKSYEGEREKTHLCMQISPVEVKTILEERKSGVTIKGVVDYLERNLKKYIDLKKENKNFKIIHGIIPTKNFIESLNDLREAKVAEIHTYKRLLGSEGYNFLEREDSCMKDDIVITAKSNPGIGLTKNILQRAYESFVAGASQIKRIRIYGIDSDNNPVKIDSEVIKKLEYIKAQLDIDGTVNSPSILAQMKSILEVSDE